MSSQAAARRDLSATLSADEEEAMKLQGDLGLEKLEDENYPSFQC